MRNSTGILCAILIVLGASVADGSMVQLSQFVSDGQTPPLAEQLLADVSFELPGPVGNNTPVALPTTLTLSIDNRTDETTVWDINEFHFNVPDGVTGMTLTPEPGWSFAFDNNPGGGQMVNGFGMFDASLLDGQGGNPQQVTPGETLVLTLNLTGLGTITENDFVTEFSGLESLGGMPMIASAKFVNGPGDASGYGATNVPEPATLVLMLTTLVAVVSRRR